MDWRDLQLVSQLARHGSLTAAAQALKLAPSTISRRVDALEAELGFALFVRRRTGYAPTPQGSAFLATLAQMDDASARLERLVERQLAQLEGKVSVSAPEPLALYLCQCLVGLNQRYPQLSVRLVHEQGQHTIGPDGGYDIGLCITPDPPESLWGWRVSVMDYVLCGAADYVAALGSQWRAAAKWIVLDERHASDAVGRYEREHVERDQIALEVSSRALHTEALRLGLGIGYAPRYTALTTPGLAALSEPIGALRAPVWLLSHESLRHQHHVRAVMEHLLEAAQGLAKQHALVLARHASVSAGESLRLVAERG